MFIPASIRPLLLSLVFGLIITIPAFAQDEDTPTAPDEIWIRAVAVGNSDKVAELMGKDQKWATLEEQGKALRLAIKLHDKALAQWLLNRAKTPAQQKQLINSHDEIGRTPLFMAVSSDQLVLAKTLILKGANLNVRTLPAGTPDEDDSSQTPLDKAFCTENVAMLRLLIESGADLKQPLLKGRDATAFAGLLKNAVTACNRPLVEFLLPRGKDFYPDNTFWFETACASNESIVKLLLAKYSPHEKPAALVKGVINYKRRDLLPLLGLSISTLPEKQRDMPALSNLPSSITELHQAVLDADLPKTKALLLSKADVEATNESGETPLHLAARYARPQIIQALLDAGASLVAVNMLGETPLHLAVKIGRGSIGRDISVQDRAASIALLLKAGANPNLGTKKGLTPLGLCLKSPFDIFTSFDGETIEPLGAENRWRERNAERYAVVAALLSGKADPNGQCTSFDQTVWRPKPTSKNVPAPKKPTVQLNPRQPSPLHYATQNGDVEIARLLLASGADPTFEDADGRTVEDWGLRRGESTPIRYDFPFANWVSSRDSTWDQALPRLFDTTAQNQILSLLATARHNPIPRIGRGPFFQAIAYGATSWVKWAIQVQPDLLKSRAAFQQYNTPGTYLGPIERDEAWTPPLVAINKNHSELAYWLVEKGAPIDQRGLNPESMIHLAYKQRYWPLFDLLIKRGASAMEFNTSGDTIMHVAARKDDTDSLEQLVLRGADVNVANRAGQTPLREAMIRRKTKAEQWLLAKGGVPKLVQAVTPPEIQ